ERALRILDRDASVVSGNDTKWFIHAPAHARDRNERPTPNAQRPTSNLKEISERFLDFPSSFYFGAASARNDRRQSGSLSDRRDHFELNRNWRRQRCDLNGRAGRTWLARPGEIFGVKSIIGWKI